MGENELLIEERNTSDHSFRTSKKSVHLILVVAVEELSKEEVQNQFLAKKM